MATGTVSAQLVISNLTVSSGKNYEIVANGLQTGALAYIDRTYTYSSVPALLQGTTYIKTANDDKALSGASFITFDVNQDVIVYVAHDDAIGTRPSWLTSSYTDTGDNLVTTDTSLSIFENNFLAGMVTLGGNEGSTDSMYSVVVVGQGGGNQAPDGVIDTPIVNQTINAGDSVSFSGTGTDPDNNTPLTYLWNFGAGSGISDNNTVTPGSRVFNNSGQFVVTFTVTDSLGLSDPTPDTVTITVSGGGGGNRHSLDAADGTPTDVVFVDNVGNVGIGTMNPGIYKLAVNGTIKTREVIVEITGWSDFVFKEDYALMPLDQLEKYIKSNKRLPQIPSAKDVAAKGIKVGSMQSKLLQKIEELTLYMIKLEKKTEEFEKENEMLKKRLKVLEKGKM